MQKAVGNLFLLEICFRSLPGEKELSQLHAKQGYLVWVDRDCSLCVTGRQVQWGTPIRKGWNMIGLPIYESFYRFTGQELDTETGLYNYNARLYDPVPCMFISSDKGGGKDGCKEPFWHFRNDCINYYPVINRYGYRVGY